MEKYLYYTVLLKNHCKEVPQGYILLSDLLVNVIPLLTFQRRVCICKHM